MSWDSFFEMIWEEREWVFSGIRITVLTTVWLIVKSIWKKKSVDKTDIHEKIQKNSENTISGSCNIVGNKNNITQNDNSNVNANLNQARRFGEKEYTVEYVSS